jgi:hypothetical protein
MPTGDTSAAEIESQWTARRREQAGVVPTVQMRPAQENPRRTSSDGPPALAASEKRQGLRQRADSPREGALDASYLRRIAALNCRVPQVSRFSRPGFSLSTLCMFIRHIFENGFASTLVMCRNCSSVAMARAICTSSRAVVISVGPCWAQPLVAIFSSLCWSGCAGAIGLW